MIILIGGISHTGKTMLSQRLLEKYHIPYISLDHIKMGLIRSDIDSGFTVGDSDELIGRKMWKMVKGMIDTALENQQNLILEGCYLPPVFMKQLPKDQVMIIYLGFSDFYIEKNFEEIISYENVIEHRQYPEERTPQELAAENSRLKKECQECLLPFFEIDEDYEEAIQQIFAYVQQNIFMIRPYQSSDLQQMEKLFRDTIQTVCKNAYTKAEREAWTRCFETEAWDTSFQKHDSMVAVLGTKIVGFADRDKSYLDRLYVHKDYQGMHIASSLVNILEQHAVQEGIAEFMTHASILGKPFFEKREYTVIRPQRVERHGQHLTNYVMKKHLV